MWRLAITVAICLPATAQISDLAVSDDGQTLLFRTAFRLQTEPDLGTQGKIYRYQNGQWTRLAAARESFGVSPDVWQPFFTSDPEIYGWQIYVGCGLCQIIVGPLVNSQLNGVALPPGFPSGNLRISRNARYIIADRYPVGGAKYLDRTTGAVTDAPGGQWGPPVREVANDGTAVLLLTPADDPGQQRAPGGLNLWRPGSGPQPIYSDASVAGVAFSATGGMVALETGFDGTQRNLIVLNTQTGERIPIATLASGVHGYSMLSQPNWDASGVNLLYLTSNSVNLWNAVTRETRKLVSNDEGFTSDALSADATIAWAVTQANRVLRIDVTAGTTEEILPPLSSAPQVNQTGVPGSAIFLRAQGFTTEQHAFDGVTELPLADTAPDGFWLQVPWEYTSIPLGIRDVVVRTRNNPFEAVASVRFTPSLGPQFASIVDTSGTPIIKAVHQDFSALVTTARPARPGETLHVYMIGLGPLDQPIATGAPGPFSPPAKPLGAVTCDQGKSATLNVPFAAYAAGMVGIYQVDVTLPDSLPNGYTNLNCRIGGLLANGQLPVSQLN
jgi:uncharacterized protein (TIGR03437 family)